MKKEEKHANVRYRRLVKRASASGDFCPFQKEFQMEFIEKFLDKDLKNKKSLNILEACCGQGRLLYYLQKFSPMQQYVGFDYVQEFIRDANVLFRDKENVTCVSGDIYNPPKGFRKKFDISFLYKTLYCLPNYEGVLRSLFRMTKKKIYITTPLYDGDVDFEVRMKMHAVHTRGDEYGTYYIYSQPRLKRYCKKLGARRVTFHEMRLPFALSKPANPDVLKTYTVPAKDGTQIEFTGIIRLDWQLIIIEL